MSERVGRLPLRGAKPQCSPPLPKQPSKLKRSDAVNAVAVRSGGFGTVGVGFRAKCRDYISLVYKIRPAPRACLKFDASSPAHMRYAIRRLRRKLPKAQILLGCWMADVDTTTIRETAKPDAVATTLRDAVRLCLEAARNSKGPSLPMTVQSPDANVHAA